MHRYQGRCRGTSAGVPELKRWIDSYADLCLPAGGRCEQSTIVPRCYENSKVAPQKLLTTFALPPSRGINKPSINGHCGCRPTLVETRFRLRSLEERRIPTTPPRPIDCATPIRNQTCAYPQLRTFSQWRPLKPPSLRSRNRARPLSTPLQRPEAQPQLLHTPTFTPLSPPADQNHRHNT